MDELWLTAMQIVYSHKGHEMTWTIVANRVSIGRGSSGGSAHLDLSPDIYVSRTHARLIERDGAIWIEDVGSMHGTTINGERVEGQCLLRPCDIIQIGETKLRVDSSPEQLRQAPVLRAREGNDRFEIVVIISRLPFDGNRMCKRL